MNDEERRLIGSTTLDVYRNLIDTISIAGGDIPHQRLLDMSMMEFLVNVANTNGIRFYCTHTHRLFGILNKSSNEKDIHRKLPIDV